MYDVSNPFLRKISETQSKYKLVKKEITQQSSYNLSLELEEDLLRREAIIELEDRKNFYTLNKDVKLYLCPSVISLIGQEYNNDDNSLIFVHTKSSGGTEKFQIRRADNSDGKYAWFKAFYDSNIENSCIKIYYDETKKTLYFDVDYNIEILNEDSTEEVDEKEIEQLFREYLVSLDIAESSITAYISHIKLMSKEAIDEGIIEKSLFDITDFELLNIEANKIRETENFIKRKETSKNINNAALNQYISFIEYYKSKNLLEEFRKFYIDNTNKLKKDEETQNRIDLRKEFLTEYPIERLKELTIEEYVLGTSNKDVFSYKIEYGKYKYVGAGIGGGSSAKHGIYLGKEGNYLGRKDEEIPNPDEFWNDFKNQMCSLLAEIGEIGKIPNITEKYPLMLSVPALLTKLGFLYYPNLFVNLCAKDKLLFIMDKFGMKVNKKAISLELSFELNKYLREKVSEVNENDPQFIGDALWRFIDIIKNKDIEDDEDEEIEEDEETEIIISEKAERITGGDNIIYYGVPGTGKSFTIDEKIGNVNKDDVLRVTFHPEYTYNDFIGQLLPTVIKEGENKGKYKYDFKEGPFTTALKRAYMFPDRNIYLILEEMSRGNCAAIFGDVFQLLDRNDDGGSRYFVDNEVVAKEILDNSNNQNIILKIEELFSGKIKIPSNLHIWGTVNTSDQNVFVMDTAFKRRFDWKYIDTKPIEKKDERGHAVENELGEKEYLNDIDLPIIYDTEVEKISWIKFYQLLNTYISSSNYLGLGEDKQLGQFFINFYRNDEEFIKDKFNNKLLHYLWFDVQEKSYKEDKKLFNDDITCFSDLYSFSQKNKKIFSDEFIKFITERL